MIRTLYYSLKIDTYYAFNSFIYVLRKLPILKDLITEDAYKSKALKTIGGFIGIVLSLSRMVVYRLLYFGIIYLIANFISTDNFAFYHIFFVLSIVGMFINNKLLNTSLKKYLSVIIFKMDAKSYLKYNLFWISITNLLLNSVCFYIFGLDIGTSNILIFLQILLRVVGEGFNIWYFRYKNNFWYNNTALYFTILLPLLACAFLPLIGIVIDMTVIYISLFIAAVISIISYLYINSFNDYKLIYKRLNNLKDVLSNEDDARRSIVDVKNKDIKIADEKVKNKHGYDYFNTIFFERHKNILLRSAKITSGILLAIYVGLIIFSIRDNSIVNYVGDFLNNRLGWFILIMYFINRGSIITQAMFYNCDHAMLKYNFYRDPKVIVGLFKKRLLTVIKVNLLPAFVIGIGNIILSCITMNSSIISIICMFLFIMILSVFFSLHYLVIYYLLQPYDTDMKIKKASYSFVTIATYLVAYQFSKLVLSSFLLSVFGLLFCVIYIILGLRLVEKFAPRTFKIN